MNLASGLLCLSERDSFPKEGFLFYCIIWWEGCHLLFCHTSPKTFVFSHCNSFLCSGCIDLFIIAISQKPFCKFNATARAPPTQSLTYASEVWRTMTPQNKQVEMCGETCTARRSLSFHADLPLCCIVVMYTGHACEVAGHLPSHRGLNLCCHWRVVHRV